MTGTVNGVDDPTGIAADPTTGEVYVANSGSNTVSVISEATGTVTATYDVAPAVVPVPTSPPVVPPPTTPTPTPAPTPPLRLALHMASARLGAKVILEATLSGAGAHLSTGTGTFSIGRRVLCVAPVRDGAARCEHASLPRAGLLKVTAVYRSGGVVRAEGQERVRPIRVHLREKVVPIGSGRDRFTTTLRSASPSFGAPRGAVTIWASGHALCATRLRPRAKGTEQVSCVGRLVARVLVVRFRPGHDYQPANLVVHVRARG